VRAAKKGETRKEIKKRAKISIEGGKPKGEDKGKKRGGLVGSPKRRGKAPRSIDLSEKSRGGKANGHRAMHQGTKRKNIDSNHKQNRVGRSGGTSRIETETAQGRNWAVGGNIKR